MRAKNFHVELPEGYVQVYHINSKSKSTGLVFNLAALIMAAAVIVPGLVWGGIGGLDYRQALLGGVIAVICFIAYLIAHELTHGAAYKLLTGHKLTFGITWSVAYCGVPDIFVTRRTALISLLAPFVLFSIVLCCLAAGMFFVDKVVYMAVIIVLGFHFGGCVGDLYTAVLLLFSLKDKKLLMRDTGPEQFFYAPDGQI